MNSKRKGNAGERELFTILTLHGIPCKRNEQRYIGGKNNPDISATIKGKPIHIEVKRVEKLNLYSAIKQAVRDSEGNAFPTVVHRTNRNEWLVTFRLNDYLKESEQ